MITGNFKQGNMKWSELSVMLPLLRHLPDPHFSFLALFLPYRPILTMDYLMVPLFLDPLITM